VIDVRLQIPVEAQTFGGIDSGRRHSHSKTAAIQAIALAAAHSLGTVNHKNTALMDMTVVAPHLALRLTTPPRRQSRSIWPNSRWFSNQASSRGELRAAAHAANKTNGVVGKMGKNRPKNPSARLSTASPRSSHCTQRGNGAAGASNPTEFTVGSVDEFEVGGSAAMPMIVPRGGNTTRNTTP
jgi:hypothetical protein